MARADKKDKQEQKEMGKPSATLKVGGISKQQLVGIRRINRSCWLRATKLFNYRSWLRLWGKDTK